MPDYIQHISTSKAQAPDLGRNGQEEDLENHLYNFVKESGVFTGANIHQVSDHIFGALCLAGAGLAGHQDDLVLPRGLQFSERLVGHPEQMWCTRGSNSQLFVLIMVLEEINHELFKLQNT